MEVAQNSALYSWLSPDFMQALGWTLAHFVWQGMALALLFYIFVAYSRSAITRYWAGVITLAMMTAVPVLTFRAMWKSVRLSPEVSTYGQGEANLIVTAGTQNSAAFTAVTHSLLSINWPVCFATVWFLGVLIFALRAVGGWILLQRFYKEKRQVLTPFLAARCAALQQSLGINRKVRFFLSSMIEAPAVIGWFRPVVLIPFTALTGLSPKQLEAILVHELAHIQRFDCFVNVFQIAVETLLFYHPAVWWVSSMVRAERENCCDDIAVAMCGDVGAYARALTIVESWRAMPTLVIAANSSSLKLRIERLLGLKAMASNVSSASIAAIGLICATGALVAGTTFRQASPQYSGVTALPVTTTRQTISPDSTQPSQLPADAPAPFALRASAKSPIPSTSATNDDSSENQRAAQTRSNDGSLDQSSYIEGLRAAGLKNIDVDELIALKIQGVTPQYVREIHSAGLTPNIGELIGMKIQGVTPEYIRKVRETWPSTNVGEIIAMKVQGVNPSDAAGYRSVGVDKLNVGQLIAFRVQGITPAYVRSLQSAGLTNLTIEHIIAAKVQGITPEFAQKARSHGFTNLSLHQLIGLKVADVF